MQDPVTTFFKKARIQVGNAMGFRSNQPTMGPQQRFSNTGPAKPTPMGPQKRYSNGPSITPDTADHRLSQNSPVPSNNSPVGGAQAAQRSARSGLPDNGPIPQVRPDQSDHRLVNRHAAPVAAKASKPSVGSVLAKSLDTSQKKMNTFDFIAKINRSK